jgi:RNA ligase (TIGR02306 family)
MLEEKSTHRTEVVKVHLEKHPEADTLSIVKVFDGYIVIVRTDDFEEGQLGAYIVPDSVVPTDRPEFSFLAKDPDNPKPYRIRVVRLRGIYSMGLLISAPLGSKEGDDVSSLLGITRYEPPITFSGREGESESPPSGMCPDYNIEDMRRYSYVFKEWEEVSISEKIHGASVRYTYDDVLDKMYASAHHRWKKVSSNVLCWKALTNHPEVEIFCKQYPHLCVYAEVYGYVQELRYGFSKGEVRIAVYDIRDKTNGNWLDVDMSRDIGKDLPWVPLVSRCNFDKQLILDYAEGNSLVPGADNIREGIVVKPIHERTHIDIGRVNLKVVSNSYLDKAISRRIKAEKKRFTQGNRPPLPHRHKWSVVSFNDKKDGYLSVKCKCEQYGIVEADSTEVKEMDNRLDELPYPFRSDYRRVQLLEGV